MADTISFTIRIMRRVTKMNAIKKVDQSAAHWILNEIIDEAKAEGAVEDLTIWKQSFIHDYYEKGIAKCKTCGREDSALEMRGDICTNCY